MTISYSRDLKTYQWTPADDRALRAEVERRFRERTPPTRIDEIMPDTRVCRGEMRRWALEVLGKQMIEASDDLEWAKRHARWYGRMAKRVIAELDPPQTRNDL